jgi:opacity protein-like surface antigen
MMHVVRIIVRSRLFFRAAWCAATLLTITAAAHAQTAGTGAPVLDVGSWTITPFGDVAFSGDLDSGTGGLGVAAGYNWRPQISIEAELSTLPSSETGGLVEVDSSLWALTGNVLYHFAQRPWRPYGAVGIGIGHGSVDVKSNDPVLAAADSADSEFVFNFGGGVERQVRDRIAIRGDLRYFFGGDLVPDYWRLGIGATFNIKGR